MFNYNKKKYHFLKPVRKSEESILERPEFMYPEPKGSRTEEHTGGELVNYLRKPRSEIGGTALIAAAAALGLTILSFRLMIIALGNPPLYVSAVAGSAAILALYAFVCGLISLAEKDKEHLFGLIGFSVGGMVLITWITTMLMGLRSG